jgi:signal transduction histidine kinase
VNDTIEEIRGLVKEGQEIKYEHAGETDIHSDKHLVKNILINLISNATKFSEKGTDVLVRTDVQDDNVSITVQDKGIGISEEDQKHLFSSFFRGKNAANIPGTGLGLHIVKRYADLLGGTLQLQSRLGEGTTITVDFPIKINTP